MTDNNRDTIVYAVGFHLLRGLFSFRFVRYAFAVLAVASAAELAYFSFN